MERNHESEERFVMPPPPPNLFTLSVEELKDSIEVLSQSHEREVDRKDAIVSTLDRDVEESDEQYQVSSEGAGARNFSTKLYSAHFVLSNIF